MNWLHNILLGFTSGFCGPMPLSAPAVQGLLRKLLDLPSEAPIFSLSCRAAVLIVLLTSGVLELRRLRRTASILKMPQRRRTTHPSLNESGTLRLLRMAALPALLGGILSVRLVQIADQLLLVSIPLILSGLLLWFPIHMRSANKDGRHLTGVDGLLMGLGVLCAAVPGFSPVAGVIAIGSMRGSHRRYSLRLAWTLFAVYLVGGMAMDLLAVVSGGFSFDGAALLNAGIGAVAAAAGSWLSLRAIRFLNRSKGLFDYCYFNWGQALLCLVLFLAV